ncbi:MAG: DUF3769 domain-containing protein [Phormidesmis sp.]
MMYFDLPPKPPAVEQVSSPSAVRQPKQLEQPSALEIPNKTPSTTAVRQLDLAQLLAPLKEEDLPALGTQSSDAVESSSTAPSSEAAPAAASETSERIQQLLGNDSSENSQRPLNPDALEPSTADDLRENDLREDDLIDIEIEATGAEEASEEEALTTEEFISQLRLTADFQEYNPETQIITARGNVLLRLNDAIIEADELWLNLINRYALADGDVLLTRGAQIVRGDRAEYNFIQQAGVVQGAIGTLFLPDIGGDLGSPLEPRQTQPTATRRAYDPISRSQENDLRPEVNSDGSIFIISDSDADLSGSDDESSLRQLRFETDKLVFDVEGWRAEAVRITNDPFSPPELELRTTSLVLRNISPTQDELLLQRPRLVFDDGFSLPLVRRRILLSRGTVNPDDLNPVPVSLGIDGRDRGGFFIGRRVPIVRNGRTRFSITPQFFVARALSDDTDSFIDLDNFGFSADLSTQLDERTTLVGSADLTGLSPSKITEKLRTTVGINRPIGDHRLNLQYSYRERLFNGTLGFQDVQSSLGAVVISPEYRLGDNGPTLTYQASSQLINAESDQEDLISAETGRTTLGRFQASASLRQNFNIWRGQPKPATQTEGLRFSAKPIIPYVDITSGLRTTGTYYTSGDFQNNLVAEVGLEGQLGHLARNFGDYTRFKVGYSQSFIGGADSPFLFDREVDRNVLSLGFTQQIYGPILAGFQTALSLSESRAISNIYSLEYTRRTYGILVQFDSVQSTGSIGFRLSNFSWIGDTDPFDTPRFRRVEGGVIEP